ncbi:SDR family oxidoreductase [bacterium SCSIO 12741]|nr:SDR family oxidoreductase [bacterium SCSIO 12741]
MSWYHKNCWITGATSGIGESLCYALASEGANLILSARRLDKLEAVAEKCRSLGSDQVWIVPLDLGSPDSIQKAVDQVSTDSIQVDYLFNNGGISQRAEAMDAGIEVDRKIMEVNYFGAVALTKAVLPMMEKSGFGHVVATSSITGVFGFPLRSAYSASKHALHGFYESLGFEVARKNIFVTIVCPGRIATDISLHAIGADGKAHGEMDEGQSGGMPADQCARIILRGVEQKKKEILVGNKELIMVYLKRYIPGLFYKLAARIKPT